MSPQRGKVTEEPGLHDSDGTTDHNLVHSKEPPRAKRTRANKRVDYRETGEDEDDIFDIFGGYTGSSATTAISFQDEDADDQYASDYTLSSDLEDCNNEYEDNKYEHDEYEDADTQVEAGYEPGPNFADSSLADHKENYHDYEGHVAAEHDGAPSSFDTGLSDNATPEQVKECKVCKETLPITDFDLHRSAIPNSRHHTCGTC
jgi:hypothetical protein